MFNAQPQIIARTSGLFQGKNTGSHITLNSEIGGRAHIGAWALKGRNMVINILDSNQRVNCKNVSLSQNKTSIKMMGRKCHFSE